MKTNKTIKGLAIAGAVLLCAPIVAVGFQAEAAVRYDELDHLFQSTLNSILDQELVGETIVSAQKEKLYDVDLNELGLIYSFEYADSEGFAMLIDDGTPKITEVCMDAVSPYSDKVNQKIYVTEGMYWQYDGSRYYECSSGLPISEEAIETVSETAYHGAINLQYASEQIDYLYRSETPYNVLFSIPVYFHGHYGGCGPVAGTNLMAYYDKFHPNLIPNYEPGKIVFGFYVFNIENETTDAVGEALYADMGTDESGTTIPQFKSGMKKYINRQGYSVGFESLKSWGNFKFDQAKTAVQSNKALAVFLNGYRGITIHQNDGYDMLGFEYTSAKHVIAGFGCLEVNYTLTNNTTRTDRYIHGSMGVGLYPNAYINVDTAKIDEALVLNIS